MDRTNAVRAAFEAGEPVFGAGASTFAPEVVETYGLLGFDFVWLDFEHDGPSPYDARLLNDLTRAAEVADTELLVRLPTPDPRMVRKAYDAGVRNLLIPRLDTAAEVREAAEAARFVYDGEPGERGAATARVTCWSGDRDGYVAEEDANVTIGTMVESATAIGNLDAILDVPELDFAFVGPADLSTSLGRPDSPDHPETREQVARIEKRVAASDVALAGIVNEPDAVVDAVDRGYDLVRCGGDLSAVRATLGDRLAEIRDRV
ncbi:MAG: HpcH/HpaI aldolase/citrate lyase family protein [Haloferacaceae archaeon]